MADRQEIEKLNQVKQAYENLQADRVDEQRRDENEKKQLVRKIYELEQDWALKNSIFQQGIQQLIENHRYPFKAGTPKSSS